MTLSVDSGKIDGYSLLLNALGAFCFVSVRALMMYLHVCLLSLHCGMEDGGDSSDSEGDP